MPGVAPSNTPTVTPSPSAHPSPSPHTSPSPKPSATTRKPPAAPAGSMNFIFVNNVNQTIWLAAYQQTPKPALKTTGWVLPVGASITVVVPDKWNGRFWGRTGCSFNSAGRGHCTTGDCGGKFQCTGYGSIPATLAEYNLNSFDNLDFYDVSMVDGSNLPMWINITKGKTKDKITKNGCINTGQYTGCTKPVNCPSVLKVAGGACISACAHFNTDAYCCRNAWAPRSVCLPTKWPVNYAAVYKDAEPYAYSYAYDDASSTFTCTGECDFKITFGLTG